MVDETDIPANEQPDVEQQPTPEPEPQEQAAPEPEEDESSKHIARLAHDAREARRRARQLQREVDTLRSQQPTGQHTDDIERQITERAVQLAALNAFNQRCNDIYDDGVKQFGKSAFSDTVRTINETFGQNMPPQFVEACEDAGDPAKLMHHLAANPDTLEDIIALPPHRMGAAIGKVAAKLESPPPKPVSKAPAPIRPVGGSSKEVDMNTCDISTYMRLEDERFMKRRSGRID